MEFLSTIADIIKDLLIFVAAMFALLVTLIVVAAKMPDGNPLKRVLTMLCYRVGATAAAGALAIPIEPIPGLDVLYDVGIPIALALYWLSLFREVPRAMAGSSTRPPIIIEHEPQRPAP